MSKDAAIAGLQRLSRAEFDLAKASEFLGEINTGSDRAVAIVWSAVIEDALGAALSRAGLLTDKVRKRPFDDKIDLAHRNGVISDEQRCDLRLICKIRNAFAHSIVGIDFATPEIETVCRHMSFIDRCLPADNPNIRRAFHYACARLWSIIGQYSAAHLIGTEGLAFPSITFGGLESA